MKTNKEQFDWYKNNVPFVETHEERIRSMVNMLLEALYVPVKGNQRLTQLDQSRIPVGYGFTDEAINWGDLKCIEVTPCSDAQNVWNVVIDEADPNCPELHRYIKEYMESWGWLVEVTTEW